jgi:nucleolin
LQGKVVKAEKPKAVLDDSSDDSAMDSSELEESSSDEEDEESDEDSDVPVKSANGKSNGAKAEEDSDEESDKDSDEESDEEIAKPTKSNVVIGSKPAPVVDNDDEDSDKDEDSDEDEKPAPVAAAGQKRKEAPAETASSPIKRSKPESNGSTSVFVGNLSWGIDEAWLASIFEPIGGVVSARIITDRETRRPKGFGYVEFETPEQAAKALELKDTEVDGRAINVDISHGKSTPGAGTPRGGGAGGDRTQRYGDNKVSEPSATLFVGNLSWETTQDGLYELFGNSGCQSVRLPTDRETGRPKGYDPLAFLY